MRKWKFINADNKQFSLTNTVANPRTVMVKSLNTVITYRTVGGPGRPEDLASEAILQLHRLPLHLQMRKGVRNEFVNKYLYFVILGPDLRKVPTLTTHISFNSSEESNLPATLLKFNIWGSKEIAKGANIQELTKGPNLYWPSVSLNSPGLRKTLQLL